MAGRPPERGGAAGGGGSGLAALGSVKSTSVREEKEKESGSGVPGPRGEAPWGASGQFRFIYGQTRQREIEAAFVGSAPEGAEGIGREHT